MTLSARLGRLLADWRVWLVTTLLLGAYALGTVRPFPGADVVFLPIFAVMFVYYVSLGPLFLVFGPAGFWTGFGLFCWALAALLVLGWDRFRASADDSPA